MMEAAHTSETSVDIQLRTRQYIPEDSELHAGVVYSLYGIVLPLHLNVMMWSCVGKISHSLSS
jgi:hypothetical protein